MSVEQAEQQAPLQSVSTRAPAAEERPGPPRPRATRWIAPAVLVLAGWATTAPNLQGELLFDDQPAIAQNPSIRSLDVSALTAPPQSPTAARPLANYSLALDYAVGGLDAARFRTTNLWLHLINALLAWALLRRLFRAPRMAVWLERRGELIAFTAALLWVCHPLCVEVVLYATQRTEALMAAFFLLTMYASLRVFEGSTRPWWYATAAVACFAGMITKETTALALPLLLLLDRGFYAGTLVAGLRAHWRLYLALLPPYPYLLWVQLGAPWSNSVSGTSLAYLKAQGEIVLGYFSQALWPRELQLDYGYLDDYHPGWTGAVVLGLLVIAALLALLRYPRAGYPGAWVFGLLAPSSSFITLQTEVGADRRMYLPLIALCLGVTVALVALVSRALRDAVISRLPAVVVAVCVALALTLGAQRLTQGQYYANRLLFWTTVIEQHPGNRRAYYSLGVVLRDRGELEAAIASLSRAHALDPNDIHVLTNLTQTCAMAGRIDEAVRYAEQAHARAPHEIPVLLNLSAVRAQTGQPERALETLREAMRLDPNHPALLAHPAARRLRAGGRD